MIHVSKPMEQCSYVVNILAHFIDFHYEIKWKRKIKKKSKQNETAENRNSLLHLGYKNSKTRFFATGNCKTKRHISRGAILQK